MNNYYQSLCTRDCKMHRHTCRTIKLKQMADNRQKWPILLIIRHLLKRLQGMDKDQQCQVTQRSWAKLDRSILSRSVACFLHLLHWCTLYYSHAVKNCQKLSKAWIKLTKIPTNSWEMQLWASTTGNQKIISKKRQYTQSNTDVSRGSVTLPFQVHGSYTNIYVAW